jgi:hypothetical protein
MHFIPYQCKVFIVLFLFDKHVEEFLILILLGKKGPNNLLFERGRLTPCFHMQFGTLWIESFQ